MRLHASHTRSRETEEETNARSERMRLHAPHTLTRKTEEETNARLQRMCLHPSHTLTRETRKRIRDLKECVFMHLIRGQEKRGNECTT